MPRARARDRDSSGSLAWADTNGATQIPMARISNGIVRQATLLGFMARSDMGNGDLNIGMFCLNGSSQRESLFFLSMDKEDLAR